MAAGASFPTGVPHLLIRASRLRQTRVGPWRRTLCRSMVCVGTVHNKYTRSPLRTARRSVGGLGNSSEGGRGAWTDAHPANKLVSARTTHALRRWRVDFIRGISLPCVQGAASSCPKRQCGDWDSFFLSAHLCAPVVKPFLPRQTEPRLNPTEN